MNAGSTDVIVTERLVLRHPEEGDAAAVAGLMSPEISRWLASWPPCVDATDAGRRIADAQGDIRTGRGLHWVIERREGSRVVGWVRVTRDGADPARGELGFWLGTAFHGAGYATEAGRAALRAAFDRLGLRVVEGGAQPSNVGSIRVMQRLGMTPAGERQVWAAARQRHERCVYYEVERTAFLAAGDERGRLRPATLADLQDVAAWIASPRDCELWAGGRVSFPIDTARLAAAIEFSGANAFALVERDELAAFGQLVRKEHGRAHLARLIVRPRLRGQGYGEQLVRGLLERAALDAFDRISLNVDAANLTAVSLYLKLGFRDAGRPATEPGSAGTRYMERTAAPGADGHDEPHGRSERGTP